MLKIDAERIVQLAASPVSTREQINSAVQAFFKGVQKAKQEERIEALRSLSQGISLPDPEAAAFMAMLCGAMVEQGMPANLIADALLKRLTAATALARQFFDTCRQVMPPNQPATPERFNTIAVQLAKTVPGAYAGWSLLAKLYPPVVTLFCAEPQARQQSRRLLDDMLAMAAINAGAHWITKMLRVPNDEPYVAIEPATRLGIAGKMSGISDNYQLQVLLMDLFPGALQPRVSPRAVAVARGQGPQQGGETITGCWDLQKWRAVRPDGTLADPKDPKSSEYMIANEAMPADIPPFENTRVILLSPSSFARTWPSRRDFANLRAGLTIDQRLEAEQVKQWLDRIAAAPR